MAILARIVTVRPLTVVEHIVMFNILSSLREHRRKAHVDVFERAAYNEEGVNLLLDASARFGKEYPGLTLTRVFPQY